MAVRKSSEAVAENNYRPLKSRLKLFRCFLCGNDTTEPTWRVGGFGMKVPLCEGCRKERNAGKKD